ncbi:MAG: asparaginase [Bacteroidetes bacterium]|jgi:beta-aspartyl-peptidase (threonine type)|nr:asparaginase [Bacteroidota bacterium]
MSGLHLQSDAQPAVEGPCLLVHGGAWDIPDDACAAHRDGLQQAVARGRTLLEEGTPAVEVVAETVAVLEAHGAFDAGCGAMLDRDGVVRLDAGLMDGATLEYGAVIGVQRIAQPIRVVHRLLVQSDGQARILTREGAEAFAKHEGFELVDNGSLICDRERTRYAQLQTEAERHHTSHSFLQSRGAPRDTVGCVAKDRAGRLAAATSTGGTPFAPPGRVGDSPLPGSGFYANQHAAASATGWGEAIAAMTLTVRSVDAVARGDAPETAIRQRLSAMHAAIQNQDGEGATGGLIVMDAAGCSAWAFTTPRMARAGWRAGGTPWVLVE